MADEEITETEEGEAAEEEETSLLAGLDTLVFNKWDPSEVTIRDQGLARYINLENRFTVHTGGRHANRWFGKSELNLVERFVNQLMRTGRYTGKKSKALGAVEDAFDIIHERTEDNPLQVMADAIQNSAPREEVTRLRYGGVSVPKAVDTAPSRRVDWALRQLSLGSMQSTYKNAQGVAECIAEELIKASRAQQDSYAVGKRDEVERVASSAR